MVDDLYISGVTFESIQAALIMIHYGYDGDTPDDLFEAAKRHVLPMQHNFENPIVAEGENAQDTWIEYWIDDDDKLTQDSIRQEMFSDDPLNPTDITNANVTYAQKVARITLRYIGRNAEMWAKLMHHLTKRESVGTILRKCCQAQFLEKPGPIKPMNIDYFGVQNTAIAFDIEFSLEYEERIRLPAKPLEYLRMAAGTIQ